MADNPVAGTATQVAVDVVGASGPVIMWLALIVFNIAVIKLLQVSLKSLDLSEVLREKATLPATVTTTTTPVVAPPVPVGAAVVAPVPVQNIVEVTKTPGAQVDQPSYSRVSGMVGATVLGCFLWALANIVIFKAFNAPNDVAPLLQNVGTFFLAGASLFAPYAFNQLSSTFKSN